MLQGKCAFITGGTAGIGKQIALTFAQQGASVAITGTNEERAAKVLQELEKAKVSDEQKFQSYLFDVSNKGIAEEMVQAYLSDFGKCDILVNNAGITRDQLLLRLKEEDWDRVLDINLKSVFILCQAFLRSMLKQRSGKIINLTSVVGMIGNPGQTNYSAAKLGMVGFTRSLALEIASRGITVNCIAPGFIETAMTDKLNDAQKEELEKKIPLKRLGQTTDIANAALFLGSDLGNYITGQTLVVDGGMTV